MIKCGECKHWEAPRSEREQGLGLCTLLSQDNRAHVELAHCFGGEGADLTCKAEFGCVLGEKK